MLDLTHGRGGGAGKESAWAREPSPKHRVDCAFLCPFWIQLPEPEEGETGARGWPGVDSEQEGQGMRSDSHRLRRERSRR